MEPDKAKELEPAELTQGELATTDEHAGQTPSADMSLLDQMLEFDPGQAETETLSRFLSENKIGNLLELWFGDLQTFENDKDAISRRLNRDVALIDEIIQTQLNEILHHQAFQRLESSYRGLRYLVETASEQESSSIKVRVLNVSWKEVNRDLERAVEFDQSQLFRKIYEEEFGTAGGQPLSVLIGDYYIRPRPTHDNPSDDIATLGEIAQIAASAFCPFIAAADPSMFGLNRFQSLEDVEDLESGFEQPEFIKWRAFREREDARFVALTLPRTLMRTPYEATERDPRSFCFREDVAAPDFRKYLWGNAAYAYGEVLIRAFAQTGWLAEIRGVNRDSDSGGIVTGLPVHYFSTDRAGIAAKSSTETAISHQQEATLTNLGFLPLSHCHDTEYCAFYGSQSVQLPKKYDLSAATQNAKISSMLQYVLCTSRFAHYLKVIARDKVGSFKTPHECSRIMHDWITRYVTPDEKASAEIKARRPLREASVDVVSEPGNPGNYLCTFRLSPHYQFDNLNASINLRTKIEVKRSTPAP